MMSSRVASLSDNVFGVAMTLLAADVVPLSAMAENANWAVLRAEMLPRVLVMVMTFAIAASYWMSHHRRLAIWSFSGSGAVYGNMLFLLAIVLLPVTSRMFGQSSSLPGHVLFGANLAVAGVLNAALWLSATAGAPWTRRRRLVAPSLVTAGWLLTALGLLFVSRNTAQTMWFCTFLMPAMVGRLSGPVSDSLAA